MKCLEFEPKFWSWFLAFYFFRSNFSLFISKKNISVPSDLRSNLTNKAVDKKEANVKVMRSHIHYDARVTLKTNLPVERIGNKF